MNRFKTILTLTLALGATSAAFAVPPGTEPRTRPVSFSDLNLSRPADAARLYQRIERAAAYVCQPLRADDLARTMRYRNCVSATVMRAVDDVPLLKQYVAQTWAAAPDK
jgi:UrcA family protein